MGYFQFSFCFSTYFLFGLAALGANMTRSRGSEPGAPCPPALAAPAHVQWICCHVLARALAMLACPRSLFSERKLLTRITVGPSTFFSAKQYEVFDVELLDVKTCVRKGFGMVSTVECK